MLKDDALSECCSSPYRLVKEKSHCGVCGKECKLKPPDLGINVSETIKLTEHLS